MAQMRVRKFFSLLLAFIFIWGVLPIMPQAATETQHLVFDVSKGCFFLGSATGSLYTGQSDAWSWDEETNTLCDAIQGGVSKDNKTLQLEKAVNDANILQFYLYNPTNPEIKIDEKRVGNLLSEFGLTLC